MCALRIAACFFLLRFFSGAFCNCGSYFQNEPKDVIVKEGEDAFFICKVSNVNRRTDSLTWVLNPKKYNIRIAPITLINEITSVLTVLNVSRTEQTQRCVLNYMDTNHVMKSCESRVARFILQYFPREDEIECGPSIAQTVIESDISSMWCKVPHGNPIVNLRWNLDDQDVYLLSRQDKLLNNKLVSKVEINVTRLIHSRLIECSVSTEYPFPDNTISCTIGSFTVLYKPILTVSTSHIVIQPNNTEDYITINCSGDGNPSVLKVSWTCIPPIESCRNETGRTLTVARNKSTFYRSPNLVATCSASNIIGGSNATSLISFARDLTAIRNQPPNCRIISLDASNVTMDAINLSLVCKVRCIGDPGDGTVRVRWQFNGSIVKEDEDYLDKEGITTFHIALRSFLSTGRNTVICETDIHQNSSIGKQNASIVVYNGKKQLSEYANGQGQDKPGNFSDTWYTNRYMDPSITSGVKTMYGQTTDTLSVQSNITIEHLQNQSYLFTVSGIVGFVLFTALMIIIGLIYRIIRAKIRKNSNDVMEVQPDTKSINDSQSVGPCLDMMNNDSDYEEPVQNSNRYLHRFKDQDVISLYEVHMLNIRPSINSQNTNDSTSSDSYQCYSMSDEEASCTSSDSTCLGSQAKSHESDDSCPSEEKYEDFPTETLPDGGHRFSDTRARPTPPPRDSTKYSF